MSVVSDEKKSQPSSSVAQYDVVVVGAGPYGLTAAANLLARGLNVAIFGKPMELWRDHMPRGMNLRSHWWATNLSEPSGKYSFKRFFEQHPQYSAKQYPVPADVFIDYAMWFQKNVVPNVDETYVSSIERKDGRFVLTLADGRVVKSKQVVMAIGLYYYANRPEEYKGLPEDLLSHSFEHNDFSRFNGKTLLVIGGGQSAVEYSALLLEAGAQVHVVSRRPVNWLAPDRSEERSWWEKLRAPNSGIAPGWRNWALEHLPYVFYTYPQDRKDRFLRNNYNAAASDWLRNRVIGKAHLHESQRVMRMEARDGGVDAILSGGETVHVDHVMLSTGYEVDLNKLPMLDPALAAQVQTDNDIPVLSHWFESVSVPGLFFIGLSAMRAFGPLFRFVVGTKSAALRVSSAVARQAPRIK